MDLKGGLVQGELSLNKMVVKRTVLWVSPELKDKIRKVQKKVEAVVEKDISLTEISDKLLKTQAQQELFEQQLFEQDNKLSKNLRFD